MKLKSDAGGVFINTKVNSLKPKNTGTLNGDDNYFTDNMYRKLLKKYNLLSVLSHDISVPLNIVNLTLARLLQCNFQENPAGIKAVVKSISQTTENLEKMLDEIIGVIKLLQTETEDVSAAEEFNLHDLVEEKKQFFLTLVVPTVTISNNIRKDLCIKTEKYILGAALQNLISNAIKFSDVGVIEISEKIRANRLYVKIVDAGCGYSNQFTNIYSDKPHGNGIGLKLINDLLHLSGGGIFLKNNTPKGTVAEIFIPLN